MNHFTSRKRSPFLLIFISFYLRLLFFRPVQQKGHILPSRQYLIRCREALLNRPPSLSLGEIMRYVISMKAGDIGISADRQVDVRTLPVSCQTYATGKNADPPPVFQTSEESWSCDRCIAFKTKFLKTTMIIKRIKIENLKVWKKKWLDNN